MNEEKHEDCVDANLSSQIHQRAPTLSEPTGRNASEVDGKEIPHSKKLLGHRTCWHNDGSPAVGLPLRLPTLALGHPWCKTRNALVFRKKENHMHKYASSLFGAQRWGTQTGLSPPQPLVWATHGRRPGRYVFKLFRSLVSLSSSLLRALSQYFKSWARGKGKSGKMCKCETDQLWVNMEQRYSRRLL